MRVDALNSLNWSMAPSLITSIEVRRKSFARIDVEALKPDRFSYIDFSPSTSMGVCSCGNRRWSCWLGRGYSRRPHWSNWRRVKWTARTIHRGGRGWHPRYLAGLLEREVLSWRSGTHGMRAFTLVWRMKPLTDAGTPECAIWLRHRIVGH